MEVEDEIEEEEEETEKKSSLVCKRKGKDEASKSNSCLS